MKHSHIAILTATVAQFALACSDATQRGDAGADPEASADLGVLEAPSSSEEVEVAPAQRVCRSTCDCPLSEICDEGLLLCVVPVPFGPQPPEGEAVCYADCQCQQGEYCEKGGYYFGYCQSPELTYSGTGNMGVADPSFVQTVMTGPVGAQVRQYNRHVSCPNAQWWEDPSFQGSVVIPSSGELVKTYPLPAPPAPLPCDNPLLGRWESYVVVGGMSSASASFTYFNSTCAGVSTAKRASNYCPAQGACNGPGCP